MWYSAGLQNRAVRNIAYCSVLGTYLWSEHPMEEFAVVHVMPTIGILVKLHANG